MSVLVTSAGRRVELVRAFIAEAEARSRGIRVHAIDMCAAMSPACRIAHGTADAPAAKDPAFAPFLLDYCERHGIRVVVPTNDHELAPLAARREEFAARGITLLVSPLPLVERCANKRRYAGLFAELGIDYPCELSADAPRFPCFAKPVNGSGSIGAQRIETPEDLAAVLRRDPALLLLDCIDDRLDEYTVDCYFDRDSTLRCAVPRQRLEVRAGEVSKGRTRREPLSGRIMAHLAALEGAVGCITVQVFADPAARTLVGVEINPRFGGGYPLSYAAGANFPGWILDEYVTGMAPSCDNRWRDGLTMLRYDAHVLVADD